MSFIKLSCADFVSAFNPVSRIACSHKKKNGALEFVRLLVTAQNGKLSAFASASNGAQSMARRIASFDTDVDLMSGDCEVLLAGEKLQSIVSAYNSLPVDEVVKIEWKKFGASGGVISVKRSKMKIDTADRSAYPSPLRLDTDHTVATMPLKQLQNISQKCRGSVAVNNSTRPAINGVNICQNAQTKSLKFTATDGYRVYENELSASNVNGDSNIIIPLQLVDMLQVLKAVDDTDLVRLRSDHKSIEVTYKDTLIRSHLIDADYPDLSELFQTEPNWLLDIDQDEMLSALTRLSVGVDKRLPAVQLELNKETQETQLTTLEGGKVIGEDCLKTDIHFKPESSLTVNINYLIQAITNVTGKKARIGQHPKDKFFVIQGDDQACRMIVLPMRA